jgi:hypothetical protein
VILSGSRLGRAGLFRGIQVMPSYPELRIPNSEFRISIALFRGMHA